MRSTGLKHKRDRHKAVSFVLIQFFMKNCINYLTIVRRLVATPLSVLIRTM